MRHATGRRKVIMTLGVMALATIPGRGATQPTVIPGSVAFEGGMNIPEGEIEIYFDDPSSSDPADPDALSTRLRSDGNAKAIEFLLTVDTDVSGVREIIARLERNDGWLIARGSTVFELGAPVRIMLHTVMY